MRLHRFYINPSSVKLSSELLIKDRLLHRQWTRVLRYDVGSRLILFDGIESEGVYEIIEVGSGAIRLGAVSQLERRLPHRRSYLFFSLLKRDKSDWVLQKCTELGVSNFVPVVASRSEKLGFNSDRASRIIIEASEQCGRSDIPVIEDPVNLEGAISSYSKGLELYVAEQSLGDSAASTNAGGDVGVFVGPEGGWVEQELDLLTSHGVSGLSLGSFTLRAETACVVASHRMLML